MKLSPRNVTNGAPAIASRARRICLGDTAGFELVDVCDARAEAGTVAGSASHLVAGFDGDDDRDVADLCRDERLDGVEQDGLVRDGTSCFAPV